MSLNVLFDNGTHKIESAGVIAQPKKTNISKLEFKQRMTSQERIAIRAAATNDPIVFDFMDLVDSAEFIDLSRQDTQDGVNYLESVGLLATGRASEILTAFVPSEEVFVN